MKINKSISEWVEKAEGDYETVVDLIKKRRKRQRYIIAFHCQQCVEKYLKALLVYHRIEFPRQHDLEELLALLLRKDPLLAPLRDELKQLTPFAVAFRYPGEEINSEESKKAVSMAKRLRVILRERLGL
ncbi:MAG TPA: DNA-binding protein [Candidatus Omnitrophica bacterium]|nr:DNA-binding protein [Candidatus Omnitrophota bacterium]